MLYLISAYSSVTELYIRHSATWHSLFKAVVLFFCLFFFFIYSYQLEANYFTILQWFLSYIDMNQPWIYMDTNYLSVVQFANRFPQFVSCFFILLTEQKIFLLKKSSFSIFPFFRFCFGCQVQQTLFLKMLTIFFYDFAKSFVSHI